MHKTLVEYTHAKCLQEFSKWESRLRDDVYSLAFCVENWGGEDEQDRYVSMDSITLTYNTQTNAAQHQRFQPREVDARWIPAFFSGPRILQIPHYEYRQALDANELIMYDRWLRQHNLFLIGKDEGERNMYSGNIKPLYKALSLACQEVARRLHHQDFIPVFGRHIPVLISYDSGSEGIISIPATVDCNPPDTLIEFLAYANSLRGTKNQWEWMLDFEK